MQTLILYENAKGKTIVYAAAYDHDQAQDAVKRCVERYGAQAKVRCVDG